MPKQKRGLISVTLPDAAKVSALRVVLAYEAAARGLTQGQALMELVTGAVDLDDYPAELKEAIARLEERRRDKAVRLALGRIAARSA